MRVASERVTALRSAVAVLLALLMAASVGAFAAAAVGATGAGGTYPMTLTDASGVHLTIGARPVRIVSMAPSVTEVLFALGLDREVIGISDSDDYPPERVRSRPRVGGVVVSLERVMALKPDLVVGMPSLQHDQLVRLRALRLPVLAVDAASVEGTVDLVRLLGRVTGRTREAEGLALFLRRRAAAVRPAVRRTVYIEVWHEPVLAAGGRTLVDDLVTRAGGANIFGDRRGYVPVPIEDVLNRNPQVILLLYPGRDRLRGRPGWAALDAVRAGRVYDLPTSLVARPGPRVVEGLDLVARLLGNGR
ncbi:MAG: cobalamin-binding protein [Armatimonadetes bacterium]|nr:cobalamin-binding protein [Armatimonadota bacterium]